MGSEDIQSKAIESQGEETSETASYDIVSVVGSSIPESYKGLIYSRWLRSHRYGNFLFKMIDSDIYYEKYHRYIELLLHKPETEVRLAVLSDDHDIVLGFCVHRDKILDYVHVHYTCRNARIGWHLVPEKITCITHYTYTGARFVTARYGSFKFNPYA
jgi:hypothetical protein